MVATPPEPAAPQPGARGVSGWLGSARGYWTAASLLLGLALLPYLSLAEAGFMVDDYAQLSMMRGDYPVARGPLELFTFSDGSPEENAALRRAGFFPWWSAPDLKLAMFRPLSCALMWLDRALFGDSPEAALGGHLHGFAWWLAMGLALAWLLRELMPAPPALLALGLFAFGDGHVMSLSWIALRNCLVSSAFALLALRAHLRWRRGHGGAQLAWALGLALLALAAGEYALPYLAYAATQELARGVRWRERVVAVGALAAIGVGYLSLRRALGFGSRASDMYVDPSSSLAAFAEAVHGRTLALVADLALGLPSGWWAYGPPIARPEWQGDLRPFRATQALVGVVGLLVLAALVLLARRHAATRAASPWLAASLLAILPVVGTFPDARLLIASQVGFSAGVALLAWHAFGAVRAGPRTASSIAACALLAVFVLVHLASSTVVSTLNVGLGRVLPEVVRRAILRLPLEEREIARQHVLLLGAADATTTIYVPMLRRAHRRPAPASCHLLTSGHVPYTLRRESLRSFTLERADDRLTVGDLYGSAFGSEPPAVGASVDLGVLRATALVVRGGVWRKARFEHALSLDDPALVMLVQTLHGFVRLTPPQVGAALVVPPAMPPLALPP